MGAFGAACAGEFRDDLRRLRAETETTTMILTRDPREALADCNALAVMDLGRIVQVGAPGDLYNRPTDAFVVRLLGPANLLQGSVESIDPRGAVVARTPIGRLIGHAPGGSATAGSPVTVAIRPESLSLGPTPLGGDANRFAATLEAPSPPRRDSPASSARTGRLARRRRHTSITSTSRHAAQGQGLMISVPPEQVLVLPTTSRKAIETIGRQGVV